jgi:hypothetical protein
MNPQTLSVMNKTRKVLKEFVLSDRMFRINRLLDYFSDRVPGYSDDLSYTYMTKP